MNFEWLSGVSTMWGVGITLAVYLALTVWTLTRSKVSILQGAPDQARWRDLRLWIVPVLIVQMWLYWMLR